MVYQEEKSSRNWKNYPNLDSIHYRYDSDGFMEAVPGCKRAVAEAIEILSSKEREIQAKSSRKSFHHLSDSAKDVLAIALRFYEQD